MLSLPPIFIFFLAHLASTVFSSLSTVFFCKNLKIIYLSFLLFFGAELGKSHFLLLLGKGKRRAGSLLSFGDHGVGKCNDLIFHPLIFLSAAFCSNMNSRVIIQTICELYIGDGRGEIEVGLEKRQ